MRALYFSDGSCLLGWLPTRAGYQLSRVGFIKRTRPLLAKQTTLRVAG